MDILPVDSQYSLPLTWTPRRVPLAVRAMACRNISAVRLARRLLERDTPSLASLQGVCAPGLIVVQSDGEDLPWVDGSVYLGREPDAPGLLLPTMLDCGLSAALLERALLKQAGANALPLAVLPMWNLLVPLGAAHPVVHAVLQAWLEGEKTA